MKKPLIFIISLSIGFSALTYAGGNDIDFKSTQVLDLYRKSPLPGNVKAKISSLTGQAVLNLWQGNPEETLNILGEIKILRIKTIWKNKADEIINLFDKKNISTHFDGFLTLIEAWAYLALSDYKTALETFKEVDSFGSNVSMQTDALIGQTLALMSLKKYKEAFSTIKVIYVENGFATSLAAHLMGKCYDYMNKPEEAMTYYQQALVHDSRNYGAHIKAAQMFEMQKKPIAAWQSYAALAMLDDDDIFLKSKLAQFAPSIKGEPINYVFYARLKNPLQKHQRYTPSAKIKVGLYSGRDGYPDELTAFGFVTSGNFKLITPGGKILLKDKAYLQYDVSINKDLLAVEIRDKWNRAVHTMQSFDIETEPGTSILIKNARGTSVFDRNYGDRELRGKVSVNITPQGIILVNTVALEDYLPGALGVAKLDVYNSEALKALAVVLRSKALHIAENNKTKGKIFDICDNPVCIDYRGLNMESRRVVEAVDGTRGEFLTDVKAKKLNTGYFTACAGHTLEGVSDTGILNPWIITPSLIYKNIISYPSRDLLCMPQETKKLADVKWSLLLDADGICRRAQRLLGIKFVSFVPVKRSIYGHILSAKFVGKKKTVTVSDFHTINLVLAGGALRSSVFYVIPLDNSKKIQAFLIRGTATGTGSGFCIRGANGLASQKKTYKEILKHYFPGAKLQTENIR